MKALSLGDGLWLVDVEEGRPVAVTIADAVVGAERALSEDERVRWLTVAGLIRAAERG